MSGSIGRGSWLRVKCFSASEKHRLLSLASGGFLGYRELFAFDVCVLFCLTANDVKQVLNSF